MFTVTAQDGAGRRRVRVSGEVDMATADAMYAAATGPSSDGPLHGVTLDLTAVTFFDSAAVHALIRIAHANRGTLRVLPSPQVCQVLNIAGLGGQPWLDTP